MNNSKLFSDEAANIYERAIGTLLKKNMLLYFSFADYEEVSVRPRNISCKNIFFFTEQIAIKAVKDTQDSSAYIFRFPHRVA